MKNIIDFILESKGLRISKRASNRPYDPKYDKLLSKKASRPEKAKELRRTKLDKQVQEFCSALVNDFMVKFYNLTNKKSRFLSFGERLSFVFNELAHDNKINDIKPKIDRSAGGCVFLRIPSEYFYDNETPHYEYILRYKYSDTFANILKNLDFYFKFYFITGQGQENISADGDTNVISLKGEAKFFASVLRRLRKHDLAKKAAGYNNISFFDIFDDVADNYNKNYFADKFKELETAYNEVLANW